MNLFERQWVVLRWPVKLLTSVERNLLEEYLDSNFQIDTVRFEPASGESGVEILGSAQGVPRKVVLEFIRKFIENPPTKPPYRVVVKDESWYED